jgi:hypothetical protein
MGNSMIWPAFLAENWLIGFGLEGHFTFTSTFIAHSCEGLWLMIRFEKLIFL